MLFRMVNTISVENLNQPDPSTWQFYIFHRQTLISLIVVNFSADQFHPYCCLFSSPILLLISS